MRKNIRGPVDFTKRAESTLTSYLGINDVILHPEKQLSEDGITTQCLTVIDICRGKITTVLCSETGSVSPEDTRFKFTDHDYPDVLRMENACWR